MACGKPEVENVALAVCCASHDFGTQNMTIMFDT